MPDQPCHCGADLRGSDHCPECLCEQYEADCGARPQPENPGDALGPCGCIDYHMADCDVLTGGSGRNTKADWDGHDWDADEGGW